MRRNGLGYVLFDGFALNGSNGKAAFIMQEGSARLINLSIKSANQGSAFSILNGSAVAEDVAIECSNKSVGVVSHGQ